jgi:AcrR family transcriptional regulator
LALIIFAAILASRGFLKMVEGTVRLAAARKTRREEAEVRGAILAAATTVFMTEGFSAANVGAIAKLAGVSTKTIYRFFETKTEILTAVITSYMEVMLPGLDAYEVAGPDGVEPTLVRMLQELSQYGLSANGVAAERLAVTEVMRVPDMIAAYYREGHEQVIKAVARWLKRQVDAGYLAIDDPQIAAAMLISMVFADLSRASLVSGEAADPAEIDRWINAGVAVFLRGVALDHR